MQRKLYLLQYCHSGISLYQVQYGVADAMYLFIVLIYSTSYIYIILLVSFFDYLHYCQPPLW